MIKCHCVSNVDEFRTKQWPTKLSCKPELNEYISSRRGETRGKITMITHKEDNDFGPYLELYISK